MFKKLIKWFLNLVGKKPRYRYEYVEDVPEKISPATLYILQNEGFNWKVIMQCPCGCREQIHLNLMEEHSPQWRISIDEKKAISLKPSVWRTVACKSHFFVRKGKIEWCK